ncbi:DUF2793 domain-containing protein [Nitratireductor sp. ZSWI3]|uniref:DUF2793 domain-containing protein n=1 Tax=Nitratireductor sp. ZSWI3 TaxID=2966359 RepID=UPI00214FAA4E|nr:DUF2793 domain-containing protein [Nitratireductor sp. ZSWI3]MCR4268272.1 DUF2793 domain-containing protein [Nitratireductor sp. ZSWI3]
MEETTHLGLPYIMPQQAQKHVTHNEALRMLDGLLQLSVADRDLASPPPAPADGDRYIVAAGADDAWTGWDGAVAHFVDGAWERLSPRAGWRAWIEDEARILVHDGSGWQPYDGIPESGAILQNAALVGIGTTADAANPFSAKLNKALWTARYASEGGDGDLFYTMNKEAAGDDVGLLLQTGFVTKALMGLFGSDDWRLSVSADGSAFSDAIRVDGASGLVALPGNARFLGHIDYDQYLAADTWTRVAINIADQNDQGAFDGGTNRFTAPAAGLYAFGASIGWKQNGSNVPAPLKAKLVLNGTTDLTAPLVTSDLAQLATDGSESALNLQAMAVLAAGDTVELQQFFGTLDGYVPAGTTRLWGFWMA